MSSGLLALPLVQTARAATSCGLTTISLPIKSCNLKLTDQTVFSWGVQVSVKGTQLCASPSTVVSTCLLEHENVCSADQLKNSGMTARQCKSRRGNFLSNGGIDVASAAETDSLASQNENWGILMNGLVPFDLATSSPLQIQVDTSVPMISGIIDRGLNHSNSHLALDDRSFLLRGLRDGGQIHANSWAIDSGSSSNLSQRSGTLTLGGYVPGKFVGRPIEYDMKSYGKRLGGRRCPLQINITQLVVNVGNSSKTLVYSEDQPLSSCIEP